MTIDLPQRVVPIGTTRYGLVIGIDIYADARLNLRCAVADAKALHDLMIDPECGCFPPENVQLLVDRDATMGNIFRALARLRRQATENDTIWIYYAGHAAVDDDAYWVTHDADVDDLFATALSSERINSVLSQIRTRRVLRILDCCYAEAIALMKNPTRQSVNPNELLFGRFEGHGIITLAASNGNQRSVELSDLGHGAFTYFLAKGLRGEADIDSDGVVTAEELWSYLRGKVSSVSGRAGSPQTPMLIGSMTHDVALTLNAAASANKRRLMCEIEKLVGMRADQLTTDEGKLCANILLRGAQTEAERHLLESLEELIDGKLTRMQFRRLLQVVKHAAHAADAVAHATVAAERVRVETAPTSRLDATRPLWQLTPPPAPPARTSAPKQAAPRRAEADTSAVTAAVPSWSKVHASEPETHEHARCEVSADERPERPPLDLARYEGWLNGRKRLDEHDESPRPVPRAVKGTAMLTVGGIVVWMLWGRAGSRSSTDASGVVSDAQTGTASRTANEPRDAGASGPDTTIEQPDRVDTRTEPTTAGQRTPPPPKAADPANPAVTGHRDAWLAGPVLGNDSAKEHINVVEITSKENGYEIWFASGFEFRCNLEFDESGDPKTLVRCHGGVASDWFATPARISLTCSMKAGRTASCSGRYQLSKEGYVDPPWNTFTFYRKLGPDEVVP